MTTFALRTRSSRTWSRLLIVSALFCAFPLALRAQDNYEIQVYGSETVAPGRTMVELHSNFTEDGQKNSINGLQPTDNAVHETLEITHGFTDWFETGFYVFTSIHEGDGWQWVGDHIRPRVRVPESWDWPIGVSLSMEAGYQQSKFSEDIWNLELRPIFDKQWGRWYFSVNPAFEKSLSGLNSSQGFVFAPAAKISYDVTKVVTVGVEYYASFGPVGAFDSWQNQEQSIYPVVDLNFSPDWEVNFGVGFGLNGGTDSMVFKLILGYRF